MPTENAPLTVIKTVLWPRLAASWPVWRLRPRRHLPRRLASTPQRRVQQWFRSSLLALPKVLTITIKRKSSKRSRNCDWTSAVPEKVCYHDHRQFSFSNAHWIRNILDGCGSSLSPATPPPCDVQVNRYRFNRIRRHPVLHSLVIAYVGFSLARAPPLC